MSTEVSPLALDLARVSDATPIAAAHLFPLHVDRWPRDDRTQNAEALEARIRSVERYARSIENPGSLSDHLTMDWSAAEEAWPRIPGSTEALLRESKLIRDAPILRGEASFP